MFYTLAYFLSFFDLMIWRNISISDIFIVIFILSATLSKRRVFVKLNGIPYLMFFLTLSIVTFFLFSKEVYFDKSVFINNLIRIGTYSLGFFVVPGYIIGTKSIQVIIDNLLNTAYLISLLGIIEFFSRLIGIPIDFRITGITLNYSLYVESSYRITTFFSEPSHLAYFLGLSINLVLIYQRENNKYEFDNKKLYVVIIAILLTMSMGGYGLLGTFALIMYSNPNFYSKTKLVNNLVKTGFMLSVIVVVAYVLFEVGVLESDVTNRIIEIINMQDGSGRHRIGGSYELFFLIKEKSYLFGCGLGQSKLFLQQTSFDFDYLYYTGQSSGINNTLIQVLIQTGIIGLVLFLLFVFKVLKRKLVLIVIFILITMSGSHLTNSFFWFFLYFIQVIFNKKETRKNIQRL